MANITMNAKDSISAKLAECFVTIGKNRYNFMQAINFEAKFEKTKKEINIWGNFISKSRKVGAIYVLA